MTRHDAHAVVLCADDSTAGRIAYWLGTSGIGAAVARNGYEARGLLAKGGARLLFTDRLLPPWPGLETAIGLKQAIAGLRVAFVGDGVPDNDDLAVAAGADVVLPPPLRRLDVLEACAVAEPAARGWTCHP